MTSTLLEPLIVVRHSSIDPRHLARDTARGLFVRVKRGAYFPIAEWQALDRTQRQLVRIEAFARTHRSLVFSHDSAAALHGLPTIGGRPDLVHVVSERTSGGRSEPGLVRHALGVADVDEASGSPATSAVRTILDLSASQEFRFALAPADALIRRDPAAADLLLGAAVRRAGSAKVRRVLEAMNPLAENAGESLSRGTMLELGFLEPRLQVEHRMASGKIYRTDTEWPELRKIGEFDGSGKYLKPEYLGTMTPGEAVIAEKEREDDLRLEGSSFARWGWMDALQIVVLRDKLLRLGVPRFGR